MLGAVAMGMLGGEGEAQEASSWRNVIACLFMVLLSGCENYV